jgi:cobalt/nickel transport system permease protein
MTRRFKLRLLPLIPALVLTSQTPAYAMHISEGILPAKWAGLWFLVALPFVVWGLRDLRRRSSTESPHFKALVGLVGAAVFIISCMPIPVPFAGTCSHPCGTGLAAILVGPAITVVITSIALILQALFLAHGGLTTLGANIVSMGVAGAFVGYGLFRLLRRLGAPATVAAMVAGVASDWATYTMTSMELSLALHQAGSWLPMFTAILVAFMPTQIPLGLLEGVLSGGAYKFVTQRRPDLFRAGNHTMLVEVPK